MGDRTEGVNDTAIEETRAQIEQTRRNMSDTLAKIGERLTPEALMNQACEKAIGIIQDKTEDLISQTQETAHETMDVIQERTGEVLRAFHDVTRDARSRLRRAWHRTLERTSIMASRAGEATRAASTSLKERIYANPVPAGVAGLTGIAVGVFLLVKRVTRSRSGIGTGR